MKFTSQIGVIGPAEASLEEQQWAEQVGSLIAEKGAVLVCGGYGGVMEAACRGAKAKGGTTVGILMGTNRDERNSYVDVAIGTGLGQARNALVVASSDVLIAVGGGFGTLSEIAIAFRSQVPVIGLKTWEAEAPRQTWPIIVAQSPEEAVELALQQANRPTPALSPERLTVMEGGGGSAPSSKRSGEPLPPDGGGERSPVHDVH